MCERAMRAEMWEPIGGIDEPCGEISFSYSPAHTATIVMAFNGVAGGPSRHLTLNFKQVVVLCSEEECPGWFMPLPEHLPKLARGDHPSWTFPLLKLMDSEALRRYDMIFHRQGQPMAHFCFISLHNIVQVIADAEVNLAWTS